MSSARRFGTFEGVFTPTVLTILGVIMYLRLGWVVGNAGFGGAVLIILLSKMVTVTTGLALSSMATNIRMGAGGSYALISRSLGAEVGSAVGIPLYLSQSLGGAMYITGFVEGWLAIFPLHDPRLVGTAVLLTLLLISFFSTKIALKSQYIIMAIVFFSLVSFFSGMGEEVKEITIWGDFGSAPFWVVFSIFFPAVTGIEAGAAMSGDLKDPRRSLPLGLLWSIGISLVVYIGVAYWFDHLASPEALRGNYTIMADVSRWRMAIIGGIFGATLSSAMGSIIGAPRTLMALGEDKAVPLARMLARRSKKGEPRYAVLVTGIVIELSLLLGDLNTIAPLLTMFFLITYGAVNLAVLVEKAIGIPSFRPSFKVPLVVPFIGTVWCIVTMFLINAVFAAAAIVLILAMYIVQVKRGLKAPWGDVRGGLFIAIAEWAAKTSARLPKSAKTWKPNLMVPIENPESWTYFMEFIRDIVFPKGTLRLFSVKVTEHGMEHHVEQLVNLLFRREHKSEDDGGDHPIDVLEQELVELAMPVKKEGIFTVARVIESHNFLEGMSIITQVMRGMFFPPNIIFLTMSEEKSKDKRLEEMIAISVREKLGTIVLSFHPKAAFGKREMVNVWLRSRSPNLDLSILIALQLERNWMGGIRLISVVDKKEKVRREEVLRKIAERGRLPGGTELIVLEGNFYDAITEAPRADLNVFGVSSELSCDWMHDVAQHVKTSCLFLNDSGEESAFA